MLAVYASAMWKQFVHAGATGQGIIYRLRKQKPS
ncbi:MAG: hypothetical protein A4E28_02122 [Methanocella sp. PtaU1.Bin125]|nr:MAG: hypothetical protein A4E28_02122 [Methanocella sp. PtaU1.Bin125]